MILLKKSLLLFLLSSFVYLQDCSKAQGLYDSGMYSDAYGEIFEIGESIYNDEDCTLLTYNILFKMENFSEARKYLNKLINLKSSNKSYYNELSDFLEKVGQNLQVSKSLTNFNIEESDDIIKEIMAILNDDKLNEIAVFHSYLGEAYKETFFASFALDADSLDFYLLDLSVKNYKNAKKINNKYDKPILDISKYLTKQGKTSMASDDFNKALAYFSKAIEYDPTYSTAHFYLGGLYRELQDYELAIKSYEAGLGSKIKNGNYKVLYLLASCYQKLNKFSMAEQFFGYSINNEPTYNKARFALANLYYSQQKYNQSESVLLEILKMDSEYIKAYELLVNIFLDTENYDLARDYTNKGISIDPKSYFLYSQLAFLDNESCLENGRFNRDCSNINSAISNANQSLSLKRNYGPGLLELGRSYTFLCNPFAAEDAIKKAKRYDRRQAKQLQDWANRYHKEICK